MPATAWESLLTRARARRDRLCGDEPECVPEPAPAHELTIRHIEAGRRGFVRVRPFARTIELSLAHAVEAAYYAEATARDLGTLWARQLADEALSYALRVASRIITQGEGRT
jgi:hypothetical protein